MDAAHDDARAQLVAADVDESDRVSRLVDDVAPFVLPLLSLDARARTACVRKAWRADASAPALWRELSFERCAVCVTDTKLAALCARAGHALLSLCLDVSATIRVTGEGLVAALRDGGCVGVRRICTPLHGPSLLSLTQVFQLVDACPHLEHTACAVSCERFAEAPELAAALPGPLRLIHYGHDVDQLITVRAADNILRDLARRNVISMRMFNLRTTGLEITELASELRVNTRLRTLAIHCKARDPDDADSSLRLAQNLGEALRVNSTITSLTLAVCGRFGEGCGTALGDALRVNRALTELVIPGNGIGDACATALIEALRVNTTLKSLDLCSNRIGHGGAAALGRMLRVNTTLTSLVLELNNIGSGGAAVLGDALQTNSVLTSLNLAGNGIDNDGAAALATALRENKTLTELLIHHNKIGDYGLILVADALRMNNTLTALSLRGTDFGDAGAAIFSEVFEVNSGLTDLDLSVTDFGDAGAFALAKALRLNTTLKTLDLQYCDDIGPDGEAALKEAALVNGTLTRLSLSDDDDDKY